MKNTPRRRRPIRLPASSSDWTSILNLFIADDVGLGKTIEAGLIASELQLRRRVRDIVVACPPSMILQWKDELENRFDLTFEISTAPTWKKSAVSAGTR